MSTQWEVEAGTAKEAARLDTLIGTAIRQMPRGRAYEALTFLFAKVAMLEAEVARLRRRLEEEGP
jgi:hypothetical protein